eukprot:NODE_1882_length_1370_cov_23.903104_g1703_i0.p1 GENE.NODE_1882_length_1370_cov_23.903104_g1703_i0~~NODE_1882_length_1370_cov_23.903104_g1703_i0.p1  ORF type:complete len:249 (+),score=55.99 NODE_1882_length_1370_cov_23.903104_g1703_i0:51-749(+)
MAENDRHEVLRLRLDKANANQTGELRVSLMWNDPSDLDLHVVPPSGERIYFGHKESLCGGWLDVDMNATGGGASLEPVENVIWASSPSGHYRVKVVNYAPRKIVDGNVDIGGADLAVPFRCALYRNGTTEWFEGAVRYGEPVDCFEFDHVGSRAVGSFVVLPASDKPTTFAESAARSGVTYNKGTGYYAVARSELIQGNKELLLHHLASDTFTIGREAVRKELGWPLGEEAG